LSTTTSTTKMAKKKKTSPRQQKQQQTTPPASVLSSSHSADNGATEDSNPSSNTLENGGIKVEFFDTVWNEDFTTNNNTAVKLVGAIDQGTSSTRFLVFSAVTSRIVASAQMEHAQLYPVTGYHEHDPVTLWQNTVACIHAVVQLLLRHSNCDWNSDTLAAIGITNQRETVIAWNRLTGRPYYNAIVWDDARTAEIAETIRTSSAASTNGSSSRTLTAVTGLPVSSYFAGTKVKWLLDHVEPLRTDVRERPEEVCFGTVDAWLLFQLTGTAPKSEATGRKLKGAAGAVNTGGVFKTDVTNASRWLFMDLQTCQWDADCVETVCAPHTLPLSTLPEICPSSHIFGTVHAECGLPVSLQGVPLAAVLGDQQAALFGQAAHSAGHAKNTYGTGLFLMMNTGPTPVASTHGLLTTVAYQLGTTGAVYYALEGSVSHAGSTIQWLRDQLNVISTAAESETLARTVVSNDGLYFVPAFSGLFAPHWRSDARGCIVGMTASHHKGHICRAALEAAAYQTKEVFDAIEKDSGCELKTLNVDGGGTHNKLLMQFQADIIQVPVVKPVVMETTSMGAAFCAGLAVGVWKDLEEIEQLWAVAETFKPKMSVETRAKNVAGWNKAVSKSLGWVGEGHENGSKEATTTVPTMTAEAKPEGREEEKKSQDLEESQPVKEVTTPPPPADDTASDESTVFGVADEVSNVGYSTATLALAAAAALGVGVLLGSARRR
jgi:glycerol kinase